MSNLHNLSNRLLYLPLYVADKVDLWLTAKGIKPVSIIVLHRSRGIFTPAHHKRVTQWLTDAKLYFAIDKNNQGMSTHLVISLSQEKIKEAISCLNNSSPKSIYKLGILLGYPQDTAFAYSFNSSSLLSITDQNLPSLKNQPELIYLNYRIRRGHESEDTKTAKFWASTIQDDLPKLDRWYKKENISFPKKITQAN